MHSSEGTQVAIRDETSIPGDKIAAETKLKEVSLDEECEAYVREVASSSDAVDYLAQLPQDSFMHIFWQQQLEAASKCKTTGKCWHPLFIHWCLYLRHRSSGAYEVLRESGIQLPSQRTLRDYTHYDQADVVFSSGVDAMLMESVSILGDVRIQGTNITMFSTVDGTALAGIDYNRTNQLLTFNDTITSIPVTMGIINNGFYEDDMTFGATFTLQSAAGYEQLVTLDPLWATTTRYQRFVSPRDFTAGSVRLTTPPNTPTLSELCVGFAIIDNSVALESNRTLSIMVMAPTRVVVPRPIVRVIIVDDHAVTVNFTSSNFTSVKKGTSVVCVSKDAMTTSSITVEFTIQSSCGNGSFSPVTYTTVLLVLQPVSMLPMTFGKDSQHSECLSQRSLPLLALLEWELLQV
ncbi:hypothetical protein EMCRGX_G003011 [Ephydatia muelleri]